MGKYALALLALAGCQFDPSGLAGSGGDGDDVVDPPDGPRVDGATIDAPASDAPVIDAPAIDALVAACAQWTYAPSNVPCSGAPAPTVAIAATVTYDTDDGSISSGTAPPSALVAQSGGGAMVRHVFVDGLTIATGGTLRVVGAHPLVVHVQDTATIDGAIVVAATGATPGAGGNDPGCADGTGGAGVDANMPGGGGGGGGGFGGAGGGGGAGGNGAGGAAGAVADDLTLRPLRGGCAGGDGADGGGTGGGAAGAGGGAIQISARVQILLGATGAIDAGGGGGAGGDGAGGNNGEGGGGGGAGGGVLLEAPVIELAGALCANGGGGGEGSGSLTSGNPGGDATCDLTAATSGGGGTLAGGNGGTGETADDPVADGATGTGGGGGGGGSVGRIVVRGAVTGTPTVASPAIATESL